MIPILTKKESYFLDKSTIKNKKLNKYYLMEKAGKLIAQFFCETVDNPFDKKVVIVCGKGNNGGDGVISHYFFKKYGVQSKILLANNDCLNNILLKKYSILQNDYNYYNENFDFSNYDYIIDALFGIGFTPKLNLFYNNLINSINANQNIISIDIPSGLSADSNCNGLYVKPKYVVTFNYTKLCHYLNPINNINVVNIGLGIPVSNSIFLICRSYVVNLLKTPNIKENIHKYNRGRCLIFAGSDRYSGAAILSASSALKTGAGYINLFMSTDSDDLINNVDTYLPEIIVKKNKRYKFPVNCPVLVGPGDFSFDDFNQKYCHTIDIFNIPLSVFDASALTENIDIYPKFSILTPHEGEFRKLFNIDSSNTINLDLLKKIQSIINFKIIILKSFNYFIITNKKIYIVNNGSRLLSVAGTGDVLSGILVSLLSQGYSRLEASILGTYLHAEAANYYMNEISNDGMTASDLVCSIPGAFNKLRKYD